MDDKKANLLVELFKTIRLLIIIACLVAIYFGFKFGVFDFIFAKKLPPKLETGIKTEEDVKKNIAEKTKSSAWQVNIEDIKEGEQPSGEVKFDPKGEGKR